jgi:hypothetical protein
MSFRSRWPTKSQNALIFGRHRFVVASIYLPNGNPQPGPKFKYKLRWFDRLIDHATDLLEQQVPVVLAVDYNVLPTDFDIYATRSYKDNALLQPEPRIAYAKMLASGWTDALRAVHPDQQMYTFWSYLRNRWPRDAGLRLDDLLMSPSIAPRLKAAGVEREIRGEADASDHAPAWIEIKTSRRSVSEGSRLRRSSHRWRTNFLRGRTQTATRAVRGRAVRQPRRGTDLFPLEGHGQFRAHRFALWHRPRSFPKTGAGASVTAN